ncbi:MAG: HigA family addiction module antitoxin, partial [Coriobacteriia bacterium]|nr:HigA family addiction module antitoxin [Coriobacteriia bacterium]
MRMIPENRIPTHPGVILREDFLIPLGITQVELASHVGIPVQRVNEIVNGKRGITSSTAWLFSEAFGTTPQFWLNLQMNRDLALNRPEVSVRPLKI